MGLYLYPGTVQLLGYYLLTHHIFIISQSSDLILTLTEAQLRYSKNRVIPYSIPNTPHTLIFNVMYPYLYP